MAKSMDFFHVVFHVVIVVKNVLHPIGTGPHGMQMGISWNRKDKKIHGIFHGNWSMKPWYFRGFHYG